MKRMIVVTALISSMLATTAHAGNVPGGILNPLWLPAAVLSTLATVTIAAPVPVVYERRPYYEPRTVIYHAPQPAVPCDTPRYRSHDRYYERQSGYYGGERGWSHEMPRYREYR